MNIRYLYSPPLDYTVVTPIAYNYRMNPKWKCLQIIDVTESTLLLYSYVINDFTKQDDEANYTNDP